MTDTNETMRINLNGLTVVAIETPTLGDRSYLVHDGQVAFVVDPQRDIDRVTTLLDEHQVRRSVLPPTPTRPTPPSETRSAPTPP